MLSLDLLLRADLDQGLAALRQRVARAGDAAADGELRAASAASLAAVDRATNWHRGARDPAGRQRGARQFALTLGRALELALLAEHATALAGTDDAHNARQACLRFQSQGVDLLRD